MASRHSELTLRPDTANTKLLVMQAALDVEKDLTKLRASLPEINWKDPAEVLDPSGEVGVDIPSILSLAQEQFIASDAKETDLGDVIIRLLQHLEVVKQEAGS